MFQDRSKKTPIKFRRTSQYNAVDINLTHFSSLASTNAVSAAPCRAVYSMLLDAAR